MHHDLSTRWSVSIVYMLVTVFGLVACNQRDGSASRGVSTDSYESAKQDALANVEVIREFHELYPDAREGITHYTGTGGPTSWNAETTLYNRYTLTLQMPLGLSDNLRKVATAGDPVFYLVEVTHVEEEAGGVISMQSGQGWEFGLTKWEELKQAQGRIEEVFEGVRTDAPVTRFDAYVKYLKENGEVD